MGYNYGICYSISNEINFHKKKKLIAPQRQITAFAS